MVPHGSDKPESLKGEVIPSAPGTALVPAGMRALGNPAAAGEDAGSAPDAGAFLKALRRRWLLAVPLALLAGAVAAGASWYFVRPKSTARTLLRVDSKPPTVLFDVSQNKSAFTEYQRAQLVLVKSRLVLNAALRQPRVAELHVIREQADPVEWLERELKADFALAPEIMRISLAGDDPQELTVVVDAVRQAYIAEIVDKERTDRNVRLEQLKKYYTDYEEILKDKRRLLRELARSVGSGDPKTLTHKQQFTLERLNRSQQELLQLQSELRKARLEADEQQAREKLVDELPVSDAAVEEQLRKDAVVLRQQSIIADLETLMETTRQRATLGNEEPAVRKLRDQVDAAKQVLEARKEKIRPAIVAEMRDRSRADLKLTSAQLQARVRIMKELEQLLDADVKNLDKETHDLGKGAIDLESYHDDLTQAEEVSKKVAAQIEALKVELGAPSRVSFAEEAVATAEGDKKRVMVAGGSGVAACALVLFMVGWWEFRARRISNLDEVKLGIGLRVVGTLPTVPRRSHRRMLSGDGRRDSYQRRLLLESVDATRTLLLHNARTQSVRTLMVTSAVGGEGKTSLSCHLAASIARSGCRTLLIDGDLRRPSVHGLFNLAGGPGFSEVLRGECEVADAIQETPVPGLVVLPAGSYDSAALQALTQESTSALFDSLKEQYDFILVDSAPVLPVADSLLIGQHVDAVVFSVLHDVSRLPALYSAYERIAMLDIRILGAVVNGVRHDTYGSDAYKYAAAPAS